MKKFTLGLIMFVALIHGGIYVFLIPPWQHYDEPSHFEYVRLLASRGKVPDTHSIDLAFRRKLVQSMIAHEFFRGVPTPDPALIEVETQVYGLEYSQLDEPPLYYFFASLPVRFLLGYNPAVQLISARIMSLGLFLLAVFAIYGITVECTQPNSSLRTWVPLSAALLPGFVELMTAVNNDVGAVATFSLFLWGSLRLLNGKVSVSTIVGILGSVLLCVGMKSSVYLAVPFVLVAFAFGFAQGSVGNWVWGAVGMICFVGLLGLFTWQDAAYWHPGTTQNIPTRIKVENAPLGEFVLQIESSALSTPTWLGSLQQPLRMPGMREVTMGVWIWLSGTSEEPVEIYSPILSTEKSTFYQTVVVDSIPKFYTFETQLPLDAYRLWLTLAPHVGSVDQIIYYDGFVLAEGKFNIDVPPSFDNEKGLSGTWDGIRFLNLLQNPSAEVSWPTLRPEIDTRLSVIMPNNMRVSTLLFGVMDWPRVDWYFYTTFNNLMQTFWGRFGWGHVPLRPSAWYSLLGLLSGVGVVGYGISMLRWFGRWDRKLFFLALVMSMVWGAALLRGEIFIFTSDVFIPGARYAYPVIGPTLLMGLIGWREIAWWRTRLLPLLPVDHLKIENIIGALFFLALDITAFYSLLSYYE